MAPARVDPAARLHRWLVRAWLAWTAFVIYGSLLPFEFRPVELDAALRSFKHLPWLNIGLGERLDWLANVLLFVPVTFLGTVVVARPAPTQAPPNARAFFGAATTAFALAAMLAVALEFAQIFFAPRTVSLNDLVAELLGSLVGSILAVATSKRLLSLMQRALTPGPATHSSWLQLYVLAYIGLCLFPFDLSTAAAVMAQKIQAGHAGWWLAAVNATEPARLALKLISEVLLALPLGIWLKTRRPAIGWPLAAVVGLVLGAVIEATQLFLLSATSQGASALTRAVGVALGARVLASAPWQRWRPTPKQTRLAAWLSLLPWLAALAALAGWHRISWSLDGWTQRLADTRLLPFYYHYYAGEAQALTSTLMCAASFAWAGVFIALVSSRRRPWAALALGSAVGMGFESALLFAAHRHPDPTNVWIAAIAAWAAHELAWWLNPFDRLAPGPADRPAVSASLALTASRSLALAIDPAGRTALMAAPSTECPPASTPRRGAIPATTWLALLLALALPRIAPGEAWADTLAAAIVGGTIWWRPAVAPVIWLPILALTDVAAWSGSRWLDTLDLVMLATGIVALLRPRVHADSESVRAGMAAPLLMLTGLLPGTLIGLQTLQWTDPNALLTPLGSAAGLMQAKGLLWALVAWLYWRRLQPTLEDSLQALTAGAAVALAGVTGLTVFERLAFVGPFDFASDYRAPGPFSAIALGGAYIECMLAALVPFAVVASLRGRNGLLQGLSAALVLAAAYATMVTFSRAGQVVFVFAASATVVACLMERRTHGPVTLAPGLHVKGLAMIVAVAGIAGIILLAPFAKSRFERLGADSDIRWSHWREGMSFSRTGLATLVFGNGLGSFGRESYVQGSPRTRPGMFTLQAENGNTWVRVQGGSLSYLDQRVEVSYEAPYTVEARIRARDGGGVQALLCEKDFVQSRECAVAHLKATADGEWHRVSVSVTLRRNSVVGWPRRPMRLTLYSGGKGAVDVDDLALIDASGRQLLRNGSFDEGVRHWLYSSDMHLTWHMKNFWLQVLFELGIAGVVAHAALLLMAAGGAWRAARAGISVAWALLSGVLALQAIGLIDSVTDAPRFQLLYMCLVLAAICAGTAVRSAPLGPRRS